MKLSKVKTSKGINLYIIKSYRYNGKSTSKVIRKCGRLEDLAKVYDDPIAHFMHVKEQLEQEEKEYYKTKGRINFTLDKKSIFENGNPARIGGHLYLRPFFRKLGLDELFKKIQEKSKIEYDLGTVIEYIVYSRILYPTSKRETADVKRFFLEEPDFELHDIYRALDVLEENADLVQKFCYKNATKIANRNKRVLYYDCTNFYFESEEEDGLRQYGVSKEHRPNPIVQMGLFTEGNGIPLCYSLHPGNTNEQITLKPLEEKVLKDFGLEKVIVCTDNGLASYDNRAFNDKQGRAFVVSQSLKKLPAHLKEWALDKKGWKKIHSDEVGFPGLEYDNDEILYKARYMKEEIPIKDNNGNQIKVNKSWRLIVTYSPKYAAYQQEILDKQIERAKKIIAHPASYKKSSINDVKRFIKNISFTKDGEIAECNKLSFDEEIYKKEQQFIGYYGLTTNLDDRPEEIVAINHNRWKIEQCFRIMKTDFKSRPVYHHKDERIKAHFLTCFLALLIFRLLQNRLKDKFTGTEILSTLRQMIYLKLPEGYLPNFAPNDVIEELNAMLDMKTDFGVYSYKDMRYLINSSKNF